MSTFTGIVIVSYNASDAVRITLASLRRAQNEARFKLILVDNASEPAERAKIQLAMKHHIADVGAAWRYIEQEENLGFSGGNNIGTVEFLADEEITHICLLNSDVIVTDHWLDRLLVSGSDIISAVTNKADGEQCVPVDYQVEFDDCLNAHAEDIHDHAYRVVADFAERWHEAWRGNLVETDVTFFCVLLSKSACRDIGLLDETFFPGGFEDDDYCLRARKAGYQIHLARDAFIHHWGSASFGKLQYEYFSGRAQRNKAFLEKKHGIVWQRRSEKPIVSFAMDIAFALRDRDRFALQAPFVELYVTNLARQVDYFETEFNNLSRALIADPRPASEALTRQVAAAHAYGDLNAHWHGVVARVRQAMVTGRSADDDTDRVESELRHISAGVHDRVESNFAIHAFITTPVEAGAPAPADIPLPATAVPALAPRPTTRWGMALWILRTGLDFLLRFDGIVFFGGYFYPERQSDGYFQRIQIVDRLFTDRWRVYVESEELRGRNLWFDRPEHKVLVLRVTGGKKRKLLVRTLALLAVLRGRNVYFHSVLRMYDNRFGQLLRLPFLRKAIDIHGVVPEEFRMHNDFFSAVRYENEEKLAVQKAGIVIVVTDAMKQYLQQKYRDALKGETVSFPMFPSFTPMLATRPWVDGKPIVVYAGGLHKWQQVPKMIAAMLHTSASCVHRFYCSEPQVVQGMLPSALAGVVTVESKTHAELMTLYPECHYGFILREDIVVNRVACPTKLVEYLAMGIVPIVDCEDIGDFKALGMCFVRLDDFLAGLIPAEELRVEMAAANFAAYEKLKAVRQAGASAIYSFFTPHKSSAGSAASMAEFAKRLLPADTFAGRLARRVRRAAVMAKPHIQDPSAAVATVQAAETSLSPPALLLPCDVLVQVDNFEAGGLENVVLDLNSTLAGAGYRVVLLVQGNQGAAVQRARDLGQTVICCAHSEPVYLDLLDHLQPQLVLAHYSFSGAQLCHRRGIPFVQVVHNVYMWFNEQQSREFAEKAAFTTAFVAVSDYVKRYSIARLGVLPDKCVVIPNGIDFAPFHELDAALVRTRLRARYQIAEREFVFLDVGAINHQKNHLGTVKAFEVAVRLGMQARLLILGPVYESQLLDELRSYIDTHGLQDRVLYCGAAAGAHEHLAMADAFATGTFFEGAQLSLLEALRANLPIVTSNVGCASHFAGRQGVELVDPAFDIAHYEGAIWEMRSTPDFEHRLAQAMLRVWNDPVRPDFSTEELSVLEKTVAYARYAELVADILGQKRVAEQQSPSLKVA